MRVHTFSSPLLRAAGLALGLLAALACVPAAQAQETRPDSARTDTARVDTIRADSARAGAPDSTRAAPAATDSTGRPRGALADSLRPPEAAGGGTPGAPGQEAPAGNAVVFSARDSMIVTFASDSADGASGEEATGDVGVLYGDAEVEQQDVTLTAYEVQILFNRNRLRALGPPEGARADSASIPRFQQGQSEAFTGSRLSFDLEAQRGRIIEARTSMSDGFVQGDAVRVAEDSTLFVRGGRYTTCDCPRDETPSYSLRSRKMKVQGKWVYTGPIQLFLYNIPMPLILPFAFLPSTSGRRGGILPPTYEFGSGDRRGLSLQDFGYYWPISDYMDLQATASIWSRGSWAVSPTFRYDKRYYYNGNLYFDYQRSLAGDVVDSDPLNRTNTKVRWVHSQQFVPSRAPNASSLRANVDLSSRNYRQVISDDFRDNVTSQTSSSVTFRKQWNDGRQNFDMQLSQRQDLSSGQANLTLPRVSFSQSNFKPFEWGNEGQGRRAGGDERWYERITTSYNGSLNNSFDFQPIEDDELARRQGLADAPDSVLAAELERPDVSWYDALFSQNAYERATGDEGQRFDYRVTHNVPVRASFHVPRFDFNLTPNFSYTEEWLPRTQRKELRTRTGFAVPGADSTAYRLDPSVDSTVVTRREPGFFATREFNAGLSSSTTFYGLFPFRAGPLRDIRHTVEPRLSFRYSPNYYSDFFGRTRSYLDPETGREQRYDIVSGRDVRGSNEQMSMNFSLGNGFETKQISIDSTGVEQEETLRLLALDANASYNFAADSLRLSDIDVRLRFPVLRRKFNVNASANLEFSPYLLNSQGRAVNRFVLGQPGFLPAKLTRFRTSIRTDFQGGEGNSRNRGPGFSGAPAGVDPSTSGPAQVPDPVPGDVPGRPTLRQGIGQYANFAIPWSLALDLSYSITNREEFQQDRFLLNANFDFNLTPKWKVSGVSGYDFDQSELTATRFNITRDLGCWQMSFTWTPFGLRESYGFNLYVKSGVLRDLLNLRVPRQNVRDRFTGTLSNAAQQIGQ